MSKAQDDSTPKRGHSVGLGVGVMNGPLKFLTARKILPLLDLLAKFSTSARLLVLPKQIFYFCSCSQKNRSARHARECSQRPFVTPWSLNQKRRAYDLVKTGFRFRLRSAYDVVKTRLSESEAEAGEPNQSQSVRTCIGIGLSFCFCFRLRHLVFTRS